MAGLLGGGLMAVLCLLVKTPGPWIRLHLVIYMLRGRLSVFFFFFICFFPCPKPPLL